MKKTFLLVLLFAWITAGCGLQGGSWVKKDGGKMDQAQLQKDYQECDRQSDCMRDRGYKWKGGSPPERTWKSYLLGTFVDYE